MELSRDLSIQAIFRSCDPSKVVSRLCLYVINYLICSRLSLGSLETSFFPRFC